MSITYLGLGSNEGNKKLFIKKAVELMQENVGNLIRISSLYETEPWGYTSQNTYINAVACFETNLKPDDLLQVTQNIEKELGRTTKSCEGVYSDRPIDIDILFYNNDIVEKQNLVIPHPLIQERIFVAEPMAEISPHFVHPILKISMERILEDLKDNK